MVAENAASSASPFRRYRVVVAPETRKCRRHSGRVQRESQEEVPKCMSHRDSIAEVMFKGFLRFAFRVPGVSARVCVCPWLRSNVIPLSR